MGDASGRSTSAVTLLVFLTLTVAATIIPASAETTLRVLMQGDSS